MGSLNKIKLSMVSQNPKSQGGKHDHIWDELKEKLPCEKTPEDLAKRKKMWPSWDNDGTGLLSLAKIDKALQDMNLPELFGLEPVEIRAFHAAINKAKK